MPILIADDDRTSREAVARRLTDWGYRVTCAEDGGEAAAVLSAEDAPRLAVLDWEMPGVSGVDLCRILRARKGGPYTYIVLATARGDGRRLVDGLGAGADDFVTKPFDLAELEMRLLAGRRVVDLQDGLVRAQRELERRALRDGLTELKNRGAITEAVNRDLARARRTGRPLSIVMADVDHFKRINDTFGHPAGDRVLVEVARRLQAGVRAQDDVGRWGGEEFLVLLPECTSAQALGVAERMRHLVAGRTVDAPQGPLVVTASFGAAGTDQGYMDLDGLVAGADSALYRAKAAGRNRTLPAETVARQDAQEPALSGPRSVSGDHCVPLPPEAPTNWGMR